MVMACSRDIPKSVTATSTLSTELMIRGPPEPPSSRKGRLAFSTMVGDMLDRGLLPGATALPAEWTNPKALGLSGSAAKSSIWLLRIRPHSSTAAREPNDVLIVSVLTKQLPHRSTTQKCDVPASSVIWSAP